MRRISLCLVAALLAGCQMTPKQSVLDSQRQLTAAEAEQLVEAMREHLYDPYTVRDLRVSTVIDLGGVPAVCVKGNPKNLMGSYVGLQTVLVYMPPNRRWSINQDMFVKGTCDVLTYRAFTEADRLKSL